MTHTNSKPNRTLVTGQVLTTPHIRIIVEKNNKIHLPTTPHSVKYDLDEFH